MERRSFLPLILATAAFWLAVSHAVAGGIPHAAGRYKAELTRQAHHVMGLDAPVAVLAAQIHQESLWSPSAISRAGAKGLAQFMPRTAAWMPDIDPELANPAPHNPSWAIRGLVTYDHWLYKRLKADTVCDRWAMTLSAYNGGLGWVLRDKKAANAAGFSRWKWWQHVELFNAGRSRANFRENRGYPRRILKDLAKRYAKAGWGLRVCYAF